ncbi:hypothetical protein BBJ28_00025838, partial [Nothophytophthora sp. Chile5]
VDEFTDGDGRRVGFRLCKSVELEELPAKDTAQLFVRAKTLTLQTWSERAPGSLEFVTMLINDLGERLPAWLVHKIVDTAAMRSACVRDHINQRRLDVLVRAAPRGLVPLSRRICCVVCTRSFSLVRKKYNCAACGDVICASCSVHQLVTTQQRLSDAAAPGGKRKARICVQCSSAMRTTELPRRASAATRPSSEDGSGRASVASSSYGYGSGKGATLLAQRASTNGSILMAQRASTGKRSDEFRRSFVSDGGTGSLDSTASSDDSGGGSVHPTGTSAAAAKGGRKTQVPNMFQFRGLSTSMGASERSSKASTSPSSPGDDTADDALLSLEVEELQPQLLGDSILSAAAGPAELLDLDVGQYKSAPGRQERDYEAEAAELAEYSDSEDGDDAGNFLHTEQLQVVRQSLSQATVVTLDADAPTVHKVEVASFLTAEENASLDAASDDSDSASFLTVDENSRIVRSQDGASFGRRAGVAGAPVPVQVEELIVEELIVEELIVEEILPENSGSVPRRSIETEVEVPMVVRKVAKRMLGSVGRRSRERRAAAPRPPGAPPAPPAVEDVLADSLASASEAAKDSQAAPPPTPEEETLKLADLQVHLDRMDQISASLRDLRQGMKETTEAPASTQSAMAALTTFETKANAERAAKIAANFISLLDRQAAPAARRAQQYLKQRGGPRASLFNLTLAMGDGSFVDYLADSTFEDVGESPDGAGFGWQAVLSRTTGKQYFFNQSCALASWTLPGPDAFRGTLYMVL